MGLHSLLQGIFPTQGSKPCLLNFLNWQADSLAFSSALVSPVKSKIYGKWSDMKVTQSSDSLWAHGLYSLWNSPGQNTGVGSLSLLQGIFPTQGSNPDLLHGRQIPYQLNHKESSTVLEWVAYSFSSRSSWPRNWTRVSCIAGGFSTNWTITEAPNLQEQCLNLKQSFCTMRKRPRRSESHPDIAEL